jgi:ubiquinone/menaquinone biosynthesis C-methylase UbiE
MPERYVHGYEEAESIRLRDQASTLVELLHADTSYPAGSRVLEAGCGVGAQTVTLCRNSPGAVITSIDISEDSLAEARDRAAAAGAGNVGFERADIFALPWPPASFDHVFVCFVLEHVAEPVRALEALGKMLVPGGSITVIEGDHGSTYFHPESAAARRAIQGVREQALAARLIAPADFDMGVADLKRTAEADGTFCYTFFKGTAVSTS